MEKGSFKLVAIVLLLVFLVVFCLSSDYFIVSDITITGNSRIEREYILQTAGLNVPVNVFAFNSKSAERELLKNTYIESVRITPDYLNRGITVKLHERILSGYIEYLDGTYLYIDENGRVLEVSGSYTERLPIVIGLRFTSFTVGEILDVQNKEAFDVVVNLAQLFNKYDMGEDIIRVDATNVNDIHLYINAIDVEFGSISDSDEKLRTINTILDTIDKNAKGFLDIKNISRPSVFRLLR